MAFSAEKLRAVLARETAEVFAHAKSECSKESLYAFAICATPSGSYVCAAANTEEALRRRAELYASKGYRAERGDSLELIAKMLRWNSDDWSYFFKAPFFDGANRILKSAGAPYEVVHDLCLDVLADLDKQGTRIVLNFSLGGNSTEEVLGYAKRINSKIIYKRFEAEVAAGMKAGNQVKSR
jgi:hypothetical protein